MPLLSRQWSRSPSGPLLCSALLLYALPFHPIHALRSHAALAWDGAPPIRPCYHPTIPRPDEVGLDPRVCVHPTVLPPKKNSCHPMLSITPISLEEANAFVQIHHRHHKPVVGHKFSIAVSEEDKVVGVAIVGRPVSRILDNGWVLEVNRCCTDGTKNACSMLYGAAWRAAKALGYRRLITYTLPDEGGASLKASGWTCVGERGGGNWNCKSRPRIDTDELLRGQKLLWEAA